MDLKIVSEKSNELMGRKEIVAQASVDAATPSRKDLLKMLGEKLGNAQDCIVIGKVDQQFGAKLVSVHASVYDSPEKAKAHEPGYKFARGTGEKKKGAAKEEKKK